MQLDEQQIEAVRRCANVTSRVVPITGQAGTGKTTLLKEVYHVLVDAGFSVVLCAPTGKAAKRIHEATGIHAVTIHRLLEYTHPGEVDEKTGKAIGWSYPRKTREVPLEYDVVLADEYAMVNYEVHRNLFDALPPGGSIRVFGDINQLQPIESNKRIARGPSPFMSLLKTFDGITLTTIHRQGIGSGIVTNGDLIRKGFSPRRLDDFTIQITANPVTTLTDFVQDMLYNCDRNFGDLNHQIITPQNTSWVGTRRLNQTLQNIFMPKADHWTDVPRHKWVTEPIRMTVGSKVICTKNNYDLEVFNGETGLVVDINSAGDLNIDFGDRIVMIPSQIAVQTRDGKWMTVDARRDIDLAYAVTTHKCQGSEYDHIIYVLNKSTSFMQNRRNFYTAITRARNIAHVITDQRSLGSSVFKKGDSR